MKIGIRAAVLAVLGCSLFGLAGCFGVGDGAGKNPAKTAENYLHAMADHDDQKVCALVADADDGPTKKGTTKWNECLAAIDEAFDSGDLQDLDKYGNASVKSAEIDGTTAKVSSNQISGVLDPDIDLTLTKYDGVWYVTDQE